MLVAALLLDGRHLRYRFTLFSCVGMDNLNQWIDDRQSFERARHQQKKKPFRRPPPPHKKSRVPPPFFISLASPKCFLPTFFSAPLLTRMIGWLPMLPSLSHTSVLSIFLSSKPHKSSVPSMRKFVSRFSLDNSTLSLLTFLLSFLLLPPLLRSNLGF